MKIEVSKGCFLDGNNIFENKIVLTPESYKDFKNHCSKKINSNKNIIPNKKPLSKQKRL